MLPRNRFAEAELIPDHPAERHFVINGFRLNEIFRRTPVCSASNKRRFPDKIFENGRNAGWTRLLFVPTKCIAVYNPLIVKVTGILKIKN
ncbi:MAG: hypothetical protein DWQ10_00485 [Calditrichaeota bacterium]|nr:MAG: hypothetical protein DWQ10_00485 [Calditrichota bacterium]